jgi:DNA-binding Xre family transcriptional regulator
MTNKHIGSSFESFLEEEGRREESEIVALKRVLAWKIGQAMREQALSKTAMADRMETSRSQLDRLLDPENTSVTLHTIQRAAMCVGLKLRLELG